MARKPLFHLHAYVCGNACISLPDVEGLIKFDSVFVKRPEGCRYAVVGVWNAAEHREDILVWDMLATRRKTNGMLIIPKPINVYEDVDQAIMATMLLYEQEA